MHKLDKQVEDILQHYGIKGMKWKVHRTPEEIKADAEAGVNAVGEALEDAGDEVMGNDSILEELGDVIDVALGGKGNMKREFAQLQDAVKDKLEDIPGEVKKRGDRILTRLFGKSKPKMTMRTYVEPVKKKDGKPHGKIVPPGSFKRKKSKEKLSGKGKISNIKYGG